METKKHFKLYKSGKQWITAAIAMVALSAGILFGGVVHADTITAGDAQAAIPSQPKSVDNQEQATDKSEVPNLSQNNNSQHVNTHGTDEMTSRSTNYDHNDNGSYGAIDSAMINNNQLHVTGWQAANAAAQAGTDNRYLIVVGHNDQGQQSELGRTKLTSNMIVSRPDVQKVHNVYNAANAGFNANVQLDINKLQTYRNAIQIISRYSSSVDGNGYYVGSDYISQPITFDKNNYAYLDQMGVVNNQLHVTGWNATNKALGKDNHYIILFDRTLNRELGRTKVASISRPDVAKTYPQVINAQNSGFDVKFSLNNVDLSHDLQIISRYSDAANGEGNYIQYWFMPQQLMATNPINQGYLDQFNISKAGEVTISGWHATDASIIENNRFLILYDRTAGRQVASFKVDNVARPDVAKIYPNVKNADQSGFNLTFKIDPQTLVPDHTYAVVSRYSTGANGNGNDGQKTDFWLDGVTLNQSAYWLDHLNMTAQGLHVSGWVASDNSLNQPYAFVFVMNNGHEVARQEVKLSARPDVANAYPALYNSVMSGFDTNIKLDDMSKLSGNLQILLRFTNDKIGNLYNGQSTDQYSKNYATNGGNFDYIKINNNQVEFSGWHASDQVFNMPYQWLIILSNGKEVGRQLINTTKDGIAGFNRNDVYNVFPEIADSVQSGFQGSMTIKDNLNNTSVQLVHRFSDDGKNGEGNRIDFWSASLPVKDSFQLGNGPLHKFGLRTINGKQYFIDTVTNQPRKNFLLQDGNKWLYFDGITGAAQNALELQFDKGTVSFDAAFINGNKAYSYDNDSIENVNGFLTADTWYRPKQILKDGITWTDSKENDLRPLLMVWWPNKQIQVDYLNYMKKNGLINVNSDFSVNEDYSTLNKATEDVQRSIEKRINNENSSEWLKTMINNFIKTESIWNKSSESEDFGGLQLQGGFLKYVNSDLTKYANSDWRLMNRTATNINGKNYGGSEFLLANDIDNSNPIVQAEELNWLYYLMNFGTITGNNSDANFDGIRVDAVDNVDVDLLSIARDYFNAAYNMEHSDANANKHLNILEDWGWDDPAYVNKIGNPQLTMDDRFRNAIMDTLSGKPEKNQGLSKLITQALVNRANDSTENEVIPSYTFVRAHDSNAQDQIRQAIQVATGKPYGQFNSEDEKKGMELYIKDQNSINKKWNLYNMPSAYTVLLTSKDTVPRVYYGDLYQDGGQYMEHQTRYYPTITNLLKTRIKYVAGGQTMDVDKNGILTSVRFGKGAMTTNDAGTAETRTEGIGVIISNNTKLALKDSDSVVLHMGAAHKNQKYRAVILTTQDGVKNFESDENAPIAYTDANGDLRFFNRNLTIGGAGIQANTAVKGYANPDVTGYLAVWVPADAPSDQDARTAASEEAHTTKTAYRSNAALDSNVIYEGFSNFIYWPTTKEERTNIKIAQNTDLFKSWGITSFEMAPQYNSSKDGTFLDSMIDNGYAFTDRYDLGMSTPNKYGSDEDLRNALQSLHKAGLQAIADWVPDQIYNLPGKEAVTVTRTDDHGNTWENSTIKNTVYVVNTIGGGEYQKKYGGAFLDDLQKQYPDLFKQKYATTGTTIDPSVKITEWSAKYLNGTNILHRGSGYVLRSNDGQYYNLGTSTKQFLPNQLTGRNKANENSFVMSTDGKYHYYNGNGEMVKNTFIQDSIGNWYFFDDKGNMVINKNFIEVNSDGTSGTYLFLNNGVSFRSGLVKTTDGVYYFDGDGRMVRNQVVKSGPMTYVLDQTGKLISESYDPSATEPHPLKPGDLSGQNV